MKESGVKMQKSRDKNQHELMLLQSVLTLDSYLLILFYY
jgi:hypothetical protein